MELLAPLQLGFDTAVSLQNLAWMLAGCVLGTLVGVLPGLGPVTAIALLLPSIHALDAMPALLLLAGIYCGAQYGGSTAAILLNVPGDASAGITAIDGHAMARQGRAGAALAVAALASFFAGTVATLVLAIFAPPLAGMAVLLGPAEHFSLMVLGLVGVAVLASGSLLKALAMIVLGLLLGQVNTDVISGVPRYAFGRPERVDGIDFIVIALGVFGLAGIVANLGQPAQQRELVARRVSGLWPTRQDLREATPAVLRGTLLGSLLGVLPGGSALLASFAASTLEKRLADHPERFGRGAVQGVAAPGSANNASAQTSFLPMLTLGIPSNAVMALMVGALTIKGISPGPQVMTSHPGLFWGLIASMGIGNLVLLVLNLLLVGLWIRLLTLPYRWLFPTILLLCCIGTCTLRNDNFGVYLMALFGLLGYVLHKLACEPAPLLLGFILGPMMEESLRRALLMSRGEWGVFMLRPLSAALLGAAVLLVLVVALPSLRGRREQGFQDA